MIANVRRRATSRRCRAALTRTAIVANYRDGILEIEIPKLEEAKPKQIQINVGANRKQINA
jgi:HSP20 family molecular chaperone IbpA